MDFHILNHPWDEAYLVRMDDCFDVFLDSVCKDFIEYFCIDIHKGNQSEVLSLCCVFMWFKYQSNCGLIECNGQSTFCFYFVEQFVKNWIQIFFEGLIELCIKPIWSWALFVQETINDDLYFFRRYGTDQNFYLILV